MHIYTETGGNSSGNERKISYFPGSIKKKKREKTKKGGRKDIERYYNFKCNSLGVRPRRAIRPIELSKRRGDTVKQFARIAGPISLSRIPYCFALPGLNGLENGADINDPACNSTPATRSISSKNDGEERRLS